MKYENIFLVIIIVLLFTYICYKFVSIRNQSCNNTLSKIMITKPTLITNCNPAYRNYTINQFCIKSSYNSAYTGSCMNIDTIPYLLTRGVRFLDFGVYGTIIPMVANSSDTSDEESLYLQDIFNIILQNAFNSSSSPNPEDPLFIHLRIYACDDKICNTIGDIIHNTFGIKLYTDGDGENKKAIPVNNYTKLSAIMGNVIIVVNCTCTDSSKCNNLAKYINIHSNTNDLISDTYSNILKQQIQSTTFDSKDTNKCMNGDTELILKMAVPDMTDLPLDLKTLYLLIQSYGVQIILCSFYNHVTLELYEDIFERGHSAFTLLSRNIRYIKNNPPPTEPSLISGIST